jgi:CRP-like cAMP-binding protein
LCGLEQDEFAALHSVKHVFRYRERETVFHEGHAALGLYVLCAGKVKLTRTGVNGRRQIVGLPEAGEVIEKHTFEEPALHQVTCETLEPSQVCLLDRTRVWALARRNGDMAVKLVRLLSGEVQRQLEQIDRLAFLTARQRLAGVLLDLDDRFGARRQGGRPLSLSLRREELAELAGVAVATAIRLLGEFREAGAVRLEGRKLTLLQPDRLSRIARVSSNPAADCV